jgi:SAM-dependent methyltransferase
MYQSHEGSGKGMSDSRLKLERLRLPDLQGKRVLDLGCSEGYFCHQAIVRGARSVVGIDYDEPSLAEARARYGGESIEFRHQSWDVLPEGPFDVVLWSSAMHYELDPKAVAARVAAVLAPGGVLVLECGVIRFPGKEMILVPRYGDARWYPTTDFLMQEILAPFVARCVSQPELTEGDLVPRAVYHCTKRRPSVLIVRGESKAGKSVLAMSITDASKTMSLDDLVSRIGQAEFHHGELQETIRDLYDPNDLGKIYRGIDERGLTAAYAALVAEVVAPSDRLVVIEGFLTDRQFEALSGVLREKAIVWSVERS